MNVLSLDQINFRDLGGLPAAGGSTRRGVLFRSEGPRYMTPQHRSELRQLGITSVFDLRSPQEREDYPHTWHDPACLVLAMEVEADLRVFGNEGRSRLLQGREPEIAIETMCETYREIPKALLPHWPVIAERILDRDGISLVNCTAGKDRTGVAVALLLELVGVKPEAIEADYLRSQIFGDNMRQAGTLEPGFMASYGFLPSRGQTDALVGVRSDYLAAARGEVDRGWAGLSGYFEAAGLTTAHQLELRARLVASQQAMDFQRGQAR